MRAIFYPSFFFCFQLQLRQFFFLFYFKFSCQFTDCLFSPFFSFQRIATSFLPTFVAVSIFSLFSLLPFLITKRSLLSGQKRRKKSSEVSKCDSNSSWRRSKICSSDAPGSLVVGGGLHCSEFCRKWEGKKEEKTISSQSLCLTVLAVSRRQKN